ncbi:hypothetical protein [Streptomyces sp. NPDC049881]|uniref:hypothetical protein n=1 Tax=unclassified Streptomyces TaxID=2593676 RepID=UPI0034491BB5
MPSFDELTRLGSPELIGHLAAGRPAAPELSKGEWQSLTELVTGRVTRLEPASGDPSWATCSDALDHVLASAVASGVMTRHQRVVRSLNASVAVLHRVPPDASVPLLDPRGRTDLLFSELTMEPAEAAALADGWQTKDIDVIRRLRQVKSLLNPALAMMRLVPGEFADARLERWAAIQPRLP